MFIFAPIITDDRTIKQNEFEIDLIPRNISLKFHPRQISRFAVHKAGFYLWIKYSAFYGLRP